MADTDPTPAPNPQPPAAPPPEPKPKEKGTDKPEPKYTDDDMQARIADAVKEHERKAEAKAKKQQEDDARKAAEEQGKFKELADKEKARADAAETQLRSLRVKDEIHAALKTNHPGYEENAVDVLPHVLAKLEADADPAATATVIAAEAKAFVDRTGPKAKAGAAAPGTPHGNRLPIGSLPAHLVKDRNNNPAVVGVASSRF